MSKNIFHDFLVFHFTNILSNYSPNVGTGMTKVRAAIKYAAK